jgi:hypothetical protein
MGRVAVPSLVAAVLMVSFIVPARASDGLATAPSVTDVDQDAPRYHLGVGKLDGTLWLGDVAVNDAIRKLAAQATGAPAPARTSTSEPDGPEESASELSGSSPIR